MNTNNKKCPQCGRSFPFDIKYCKQCGTLLENIQYDTANNLQKKCSICGMKNEKGAVYCKQCGNVLGSGNNNLDKNKNKLLNSNFFSIISAVIAVIIIGILFYVILCKIGVIGSKDVKRINQKSSSVDVKKKNVTTEEKTVVTTEDALEKDDSSSYQPYYSLGYADNSFPDEDSCLSPADYEVFYAEDFSFGYPKYIFSDSYVNEAEGVYRLWSEDDYILEVSVKDVDNSHSYSRKQIVHMIYEEYINKYNEIYFQRDVKDVDDSGYARALIGGYYNNHGEYVIIACNGSKTYILTMEYPDRDPDVFFKPINYIVDCVYRYCSFSGTTYKPRTYQQFLNDDMGSKK